MQQMKVEVDRSSNEDVLEQSAEAVGNNGPTPDLLDLIVDFPLCKKGFLECI